MTVRAALPALVLLASTAQAAFEVPARPDRYASDRAGVIGAARLSALDERLAQFERETSSQVLVYLDRRLPANTTIEEFGNRAFREWKVGQKDEDNGVVFFVFVDDRKMRIEVGYGLEGALPDARAARIVEDYAKPRFRANDYAGGVEAAVDQVMRAARGEPYRGTGATHAESRPVSGDGRAPLAYWLPAIVALAIGGLAARSRTGPERWFRVSLVTGIATLLLSIVVTGIAHDGRPAAIGLGVLLLSLVPVLWSVVGTGERLGGRRALGRRITVAAACALLVGLGITVFAAVLGARAPYLLSAMLVALAALPLGGLIYARNPAQVLTLAAGRLAAVVFIPSVLLAVFFAVIGEREMLPSFVDWILPSGVVWLAATIFARSRSWVIWPKRGGGTYSGTGYAGGSSWSSSDWSSSDGGSSFSGGGGDSGGGGASGDW
jgi:uncharacterized protein